MVMRVQDFFLHSFLFAFFSMTSYNKNMQKYIILLWRNLIFLFIAFIFICSNKITSKAADAIPYILDMDFCSDVDDAMAVRVATELDKAGKIELLACMLSTNGENQIKALNGLLNYDGYGDLPIGYSTFDIPDGSSYWNVLVPYCQDSIKKMRAVYLYDKLLKESDDKVTILTTGYVSNIAALIKLDKNLVRDKVECIYIQGSSYSDGWDNNLGYNERAISSIKYVIENSPVPVIFIDNSVGGVFKVGDELHTIDTLKTDPLTKCLDVFGCEDGKGRTSWDATAVWVSVFSREETNTQEFDIFFKIYEDGSQKILLDTETPNSKMILRTSEDTTWYAAQVNSYISANYYRNEKE